MQFYVGSFLKVHNPLFSFGNAMFSFVNTIKMLGMLLNLVHLQVHKKKQITKDFDGFHNHSIPLTMIWLKTVKGFNYS